MGNVEGRDIYDGHVRVVICDGFVGNVLLKAGEGAVEFLFSTLKRSWPGCCPTCPADAGHEIAGSLKRLKTRFEYEEFGGGPLLGIRGACIICHGASGARAIKNALRVAGTMAAERLHDRIVEQLGGARCTQSVGRRAGPGNSCQRGRCVPASARGAPTMAKIAFLFPGQGAQAVGMCRELDQELPAVRDSVRPGRRDPRHRPEAPLLRGAGRGARGDRRQPAGDLRRQPGGPREPEGQQPGVVASCEGAAGLSLGEYTALVFAGALDFESGLQVVRRRGQAMQAAAARDAQRHDQRARPRRGQGRRALPPGRPAGRLWKANLLGPGNIVVSGEAAALEARSSRSPPSSGP